VYRAQDTIEGIPVAIKVPHHRLLTKQVLALFRKEVRLVANLDHPNILPIKTANYIDRWFVIVYPLGTETLADRLHRRLSVRTALDFAEQILDAVAYAHERYIIHCDIKPDNLILFPEGRLRLSDFGIAKVTQRTRALKASGTGTIGYLAPEQALGKPSFRSDVFAVGVLLYRMFSGQLPEWPYDWPPPGIERLKQNLPANFIDFLRRAIQVDERLRFADAIQMQSAFLRLRPKILQKIGRPGQRRKKKVAKKNGSWKNVRFREFKRFYGKSLGIRHNCSRCRGPIGESMQHCPWCGTQRKRYTGPTSFPRRCKRCRRGLKKDWRFCPWCYGGRLESTSSRKYADARYVTKCTGSSCERKHLMKYMRYCPWCHTKVEKKWKVPDSKGKCSRCNWGLLNDFWDFCPWCGKTQRKR
jgi:serine/threonine-protein kinase